MAEVDERVVGDAAIVRQSGAIKVLALLVGLGMCGVLALWGGAIGRAFTKAQISTPTPSSAAIVGPANANQPIPTSAAKVGTAHYPSPYPAWPNAVAWTAKIDATRAAANIKPYDAAAKEFYLSYGPNWSQVAGATPAWNTGSNVVISSTEPGVGIYFAAVGDPTYTFSCAGDNWCGYSTGITNVHIPAGARTQNSGNRSCDCHLFLIEPVGWKPASNNGTVWPDVSPYQYEFDIENAATNLSCMDNPAQWSTACTTFSGGGTIYADGAVLYSTGSTGFYGGSTPLNDGFGPANGIPTHTPTSWAGQGQHGGTALTAGIVTPGDILQGAINHETHMGLLCLQAPQSDSWPSPNTGTDFDCSKVGGTATTGWSYGDHIWLQRSDAQIAADVAAGTLTPIQGIYATSLAQYGAITMDTVGKWGPTWLNWLTDGDPGWEAVARRYNLPTVTYGGKTQYLINMTLPGNYIRSYLHAINSCVVQGTCTTAATRAPKADIPKAYPTGSSARS